MVSLSFLPARNLLVGFFAAGLSCLFGVVNDAGAQESVTTPYTGSKVFQAGDAVQATYAGTWTNARVVEVDKEGGRYKIHFEGEKYCNGHVLDSWIARQWVRPAGPAKPAAAPAGTPKPAPGTTTPPKAGGNAGKAAAPVAGTFKVGETVMVRGASVLWHGGARIEKYDPERRMYHVRYDHGSGDIVPCHSVSRPGPADNSFFVGSWDVYVNGATSTFVKDGDLYRRFSGGAKLAPLEIKADGSYTWRQEKNKVIKGRWTARKDAPGIVLLKGLDGKDWTLYEKTEGYAPTARTRDEIGFHHMPSQTGYYVAYRIGANKSCVLAGRQFAK